MKEILLTATLNGNSMKPYGYNATQNGMTFKGTRRWSTAKALIKAMHQARKAQPDADIKFDLSAIRLSDPCVVDAYDSFARGGA